ncbi:MAG: HAD-IIIC family phosphatase [Candidatus Sungbacteria bacterium]|uniref:HAD-IIIC family phosphatase n=1 Tax=Candidatus Sungiibacteriota bacterium TaxID=2750080 RepID=A0A9D6LT60_9BACT|nr:HAD-IIIC family phosphatase [Candidatus Sungbacteria bacterium]
MNALDYLKLASRISETDRGRFPSTISVNIITNFTDDVFLKVLTGICLENSIYPVIWRAPYKQYHLAFKSGEIPKDVAITFIFFYLNPYLYSEFYNPDQVNELFDDIEKFAESTKGTVVMNSFITPYRGAYGNLFDKSELFSLAENYNRSLFELEKRLKNFRVLDVNRLMHTLGERQARDFRGMYAFDFPFTNDFAVEVAKEWFSYIRVLLGKIKKCIVVDLDDTVWGGILGEVGPLGILLGEDYPGRCYQNFQRALVEFHNRGILLAINSRNNWEDVKEVFNQNPHMVLKESHFASIQTNWNNKADNLRAIAEELNIGLDSFVFFDDDPNNRALVKTMLPEVLVPEFSIAPEEYVNMLYGLDEFNQFALTEEDTARAKMYAEERQRKVVEKGSASFDEYIAGLQIVVNVSVNKLEYLTRLSQLTLKTNQFNLTTKRYSESEVADLIKKGCRFFAGDIQDKFGRYGVTILAILSPQENGVVRIDNFLMSCRVAGRGVEFTFFDYLLELLASEGVKKVTGLLIETQKNPPVREILPNLGFKIKEKGEGGTLFEINLEEYQMCQQPNVNRHIKIGS